MAETTQAQVFWEDFYRERPVWSGRPNALLVREVEALPPGTALDLGCAEGADAVWLAQRGWRVTGADAAPSALRRAATHAAEAGVTVDWQCHDLSRTFPGGLFDLVCAQYLHTPDEVPGSGRRSCAAPRRPSRPAACCSSSGTRSTSGTPRPTCRPPARCGPGWRWTPDAWHVEREEVVEREVTDPDGRPATRRDNVLRLRRTR